MIKEHGVYAGMTRINDKVYLHFKAKGKLTHEDYDMMTPVLEDAMANAKQDDIRVLVDCIGFEGWELQAAWDDFKLGVKYGFKFNKVAVVGDKPWEKVCTKVASWFMPAEVDYFESVAEAVNWLEGDTVE